MSTTQNKVSMCCEKCRSRGRICAIAHGSSGNFSICGNSACPCHTDKGGEKANLLITHENTCCGLCGLKGMHNTVHICDAEGLRTREAAQVPSHSFTMEEDSIRKIIAAPFLNPPLDQIVLDEVRPTLNWQVKEIQSFLFAAILAERERILKTLRTDGRDIVTGNKFENPAFKDGYIRANKDIINFSLK